MTIILDADLVIRGEKGTFDLKKWVAWRPVPTSNSSGSQVATFKRSPLRANKRTQLETK
jgi:hypothetical protein